MASPAEPMGRRARNKQDKLDRIVLAASELFAVRGVDEVTTQEIADRADIGAGTLFLYARTKGELLLLVQNTAYERALERGEADAARVKDVGEALLAIIRPIVECNRSHPGNGRTYLREMVFGDAQEEHHRTALRIAGRTERAFAGILSRDGHLAEAAGTIARVVSAIMYLAMANAGSDLSTGDIIDQIELQVAVLLPR